MNEYLLKIGEWFVPPYGYWIEPSGKVHIVEGETEHENRLSDIAPDIYNAGRYPRKEAMKRGWIRIAIDERGRLLIEGNIKKIRQYWNTIVDIAIQCELKTIDVEFRDGDSNIVGIDYLSLDEALERKPRMPMTESNPSHGKFPQLLEILIADFYKFYNRKMARCVNVSNEFSEFLSLHGIDSHVVWAVVKRRIPISSPGYPRGWNPNLEHAWVEVRMDRKWYVVDITGPRQFGLSKPLFEREEYRTLWNIVNYRDSAQSNPSRGEEMDTPYGRGEYLGRGHHVRKAIRVGNKVYLFMKTQDLMKDALAENRFDSPHIPPVERIYDERTDSYVYVMPYYRTITAADREAWNIMRELKTAKDRVEIGWRNKLTRINEYHLLSTYWYEVGNEIIEEAEVPASIKEALTELLNQAGNYGSAWFEFDKRNVGVDSQGRVIFRDVIFDMDKLMRERSTKRRGL